MLSHEVRIFNMMVMTIIVVMILSLFILFILSHRSQQAERKKLEYLSSHDPLTKLENLLKIWRKRLTKLFIRLSERGGMDLHGIIKKLSNYS